MTSDDHGLSFGQWLRRRRKALDLTQAELAARVPCAKGTIRRIEADDLRPSKALAERLADVLMLADTSRSDFVRFARGGLVEWSVAAPAPEATAPLRQPEGRRAAVSALPVRKRVLRSDLSTLHGRQYSLAIAVEMLRRPDVRLVTLVGPPGVGKTRLARAIGVQIQERYRDGICWVELAPLHDPAYVLPAIAQALDLADSGAPLPVRLADRLRAEELLLILDNCEHVLAAAPAIGGLLSAAPGLQVLCTSRAALHISGEHQFVVPPLALPDRSESVPAAELEANPAVALFLARVRAAQPTYRVGEVGLSQIAAVCHRLDGLPLAIELAANRARLFTPAALLERLDRRLPVLTNGARDAPARQHTLEAAIGWSYDLLQAPTQQCLACLGVFAGGATLAAIEAVCAADGDILALVTTLVDHHLLQASSPDDGEVRFTLLETIREFALARLDERGGRATVQARHSRYYLELAIAAEHGLQAADQVRWMNRLHAEDNNLRAAFDWSLAPEGDPRLGLRAGAGLWWYWWTNGQVREGRRRLAHLLDRARAQGLGETHDYSRALLGAGILDFFDGDFALAQPRFTDARTLGARLADMISHGYATFMLGTVLVLAGQHSEGYALLDGGMRTLREVGEPADWYVAVTSLASTLLVLERGDLLAAERYADAGMAIFRRLGQPYGIGLAYNYQGDVARLRGDLASAATLYQAALPLLREAHARSEIPAVLHNLALVVLARGDARHAGALLAEAFELHREIGNTIGMAECLNGLAATLLALGRPEPAALLLGALETMLAGVRVPLFAAEQALYQRTAAALHTLQPTRTELQQRAGSAMTSAAVARFVGALAIEIGTHASSITT
jgi:predicted ATPase/transcriptional regulator with XRE-family HTH domain